jgi:hypothetical protein
MSFEETQVGAMKTGAVIFAALGLFGFSLAAELDTPEKPQANPCVDEIIAKASVEPDLDSDFFRSKEGSYPFHIVEHDDGSLENTMGGKVSPKDAVKIKHTAKILSSHQGEHRMSYCHAEQVNGGLMLFVTGGLPAYASRLTLHIDAEKNLKCRFSAVYPITIPGEKLEWKITKKTFRMKSGEFKAATRLLGWLSVEFEETCTVDGKVTRQNHKIEGYVKPVIRKSKAHSDEKSEKGAPDPLPLAPSFQ